MKTWKLSIKPKSEKGFDAFKKCKEKSLLGLGWHHAYIENHPSNLSQAKMLVKEKWNKWPYQLKYLLEDMKEGDHVWIHQKGKYYLCRVEDNSILYGKDIDPEYRNYDLGHARKATWIEVPDKFVSGAIQRGTIARRTIQQIDISDEETECNKRIFRELHADPDWKPNIYDGDLAESVAKITKKELFSLMSPDDVEDVVCAYLQSKGWVLVKSTCFRSKPKFEFSMLNENGKIAHVQVKSGNSDPLKPLDYKDCTDDRTLVYLFSTYEHPYPGPSVPNVCLIKHSDIYNWSINTVWGLTLPLRYKLRIFLECKL